VSRGSPRTAPPKRISAPGSYAGKVAERTFETAYLEYGIAQDLTRGTDRHMWFLHDPIEDHPDRTWEDYLANYQRTLVASLLHPGVSRYEVAPWPNRIFNRPYLREGSTERQPIPPDTATSYLIAMNSLRDLDQPEVRWAGEGPRIGIALSDTAMFQRWAPVLAVDTTRGDTTTASRMPWHWKAANSCTSPTSTVWRCHRCATGSGCVRSSWRT
jgi:hypothetical protein